MVNWHFSEYFLMNTPEYVASKTKPVLSEPQIPRPAALLKELKCMCFVAKCILRGTSLSFWQNLLSVYEIPDQLLQHGESFTTQLCLLKNKMDVAELCSCLFRVAIIICLEIILEMLTDFKSCAEAYIEWVSCFYFFACGISSDTK